MDDLTPSSTLPPLDAEGVVSPFPTQSLTTPRPEGGLDHSVSPSGTTSSGFLSVDITSDDMELVAGRATARSMKMAVDRVKLLRLAMRGLTARQAAQALGVGEAVAMHHYRDPVFQKTVMERVSKVFGEGDNLFKGRVKTLHERIQEQAERSFEGLVEMLEKDSLPDSIRMKIHQDFLDRSPDSQKEGTLNLKMPIDAVQLSLAAQVALELDSKRQSVPPSTIGRVVGHSDSPSSSSSGRGDFYEGGDDEGGGDWGEKDVTSVLRMASSGQADKVLQDIRVRSLYSPYYLTKVVLGYKQLVDHLHLHDSELFIQRWIGGVRKQWIEWPRGFFKSTTFTIGTGIWVTLPCSDRDTEYAIEDLGIDEGEWLARMSLHNQDVTQLLAFETILNAKKKINEIKWHFEENDLFRTLFPEIAYSGTESPWTTDCLKIRRVGDGRRVQEGTFEAIGVEGALQSRHYDIVWEDDLVGKKAVESDVTMQSTIRWHGLLHGAFVNAAEQIRFGVSNRWGYADLNSYVRDNEPDFQFYTRRAWEIDPETGKEIAIFPERYPMDKLFKIRDEGSMTKYDFSCQYLNDPVLPGESEASIGTLHTYSVEPDGKMVCSCGSSFYPSQLLRSLHYDPYNAKNVGSGSCPAVVLVGTSTDRHIALIDYWVNKGSYANVYGKLYQFNDIWRPYLFTYEDVGHQNITEFHIREMEKTVEHREKHRRFPRIVAVPTHGKAKEIRIREHFLPTLRKYKFTRRKTHLEFDRQLETFPNKVLGHDYDILDALAQGALYWKAPDSEETAAERKQAQDAILAQLGRPYTHMEYSE